MQPIAFLHLTDPHVAPPGETLAGQDTGARFEAAVTAIAARHAWGGDAPAAFAVITGDLTRDGESAAYARLATLVARLPCPAHLMMGNHDSRIAFAEAFPQAPRDPGGFIQHAFATPAGRCILLDTLEPGAPHGTLCARRLGWLADRLAEEDGPVLLFLHHPPLPVGIPGMDAIALRAPEALWAVLAPHAGRIRHIFHGHLHRPIAGSWHGIPLSSLRGTAFEVRMHGGKPAIEPDAPIDYGYVRADADGIVIHTERVAPLA
ncbi:MAG TPA: phosphodiesterase [Roseomonas sp.]|jgi:3',5'-cyclic AMP phosphodiesterase CpdA